MSKTKETTEKSQAKGAVRHRKIIRDSIQGITKPGIARICQRAGIVRIGGTVYEEFRGVMKVYVDSLMKDIVAITLHDKRRTVMESDLEAALQIRGIYLGAAENPNTSKTFSTIKSRTKNSKAAAPSDGSEKDAESTTKVTKPHKFRPGTVALRDIRHQQKHSDEFAFPKANFERLVREIGQDYGEDLRYNRKFKELFQLVVETYLIELMSCSNLCALHIKRQTVLPKDIQLARRIRNERF